VDINGGWFDSKNLIKGDPMDIGGGSNTTFENLCSSFRCCLIIVRRRIYLGRIHLTLTMQLLTTVNIESESITMITFGTRLGWTSSRVVQIIITNIFKGSCIHWGKSCRLLGGILCWHLKKDGCGNIHIWNINRRQNLITDGRVLGR